MLKFIKVTGNSLSPFFLPGDYVLVSTFRPLFKNLKPGSTVVFNHPEYGLLIKRVQANYPETGSMKVTGVHANSISSHQLGLVPYEDLTGNVLFQIKHPRNHGEDSPIKQNRR